MFGIRRLQRTLGDFGHWLSAGGPELDELVQRSRAAGQLPPGHKKDPETWAMVAGDRLEKALRLAKYLPDPRKRKGRPRGPSKTTIAHVQAMRAHLETHGGTDSAAARHVLTNGGKQVVSGLPNRVRTLVKAHRQVGK